MTHDDARLMMRLMLSSVLQLVLIVVLVLVAKARRHRVSWNRERAINIGFLCGLYLAILYFAGWVLGMSAGIGVLAYPFTVYFLALSIFRTRDIEGTPASKEAAALDARLRMAYRKDGVRDSDD